MQLVEDEYIATFKYQLMDVVYAWAHGKSFAEIWYACPHSHVKSTR